VGFGKNSKEGGGMTEMVGSFTEMDSKSDEGGGKK
jgi:hypothetical protein